MQGIGRKLKQLRGKLYTQKEVSEATGIPLSTIAAYETNLRQPSLDNLRTPASFYKVSPGYLLDNESSGTFPPELQEIYHYITERPDLKLLFKEGRELGDEELKLICQIIKSIKKNS